MHGTSIKICIYVFTHFWWCVPGALHISKMMYGAAFILNKTQNFLKLKNSFSGTNIRRETSENIVTKRNVYVISYCPHSDIIKGFVKVLSLSLPTRLLHKLQLSGSIHGRSAYTVESNLLLVVYLSEVPFLYVYILCSLGNQLATECAAFHAMQ
jgi:hypothetical protein